MSARTADAELSLQQNVIRQQCLLLRLPTLAGQSGPLAEQAERERQPYLGYLETLLAAELEERERRAIERRIKDAHLPRVKTLDEFDFRQAPLVSPTRMSELAEGSYIERAEPIVFIGDSGTGKTHLASMAIHAAERPSLVVTPTIDLMNQWYDELTLCFEADVGLFGGALAKSIPILANFETAGIILGGLAFAAIAIGLYRWILRLAPSGGQ